MGNHKKVKAAKKEYIVCMGERLGKLFYALNQEVEWLYMKWNEYIALYGTEPSRIDLLNKAAPLFFRVVQDSLFEGTLLHITRLTDPPKSAGKENLTIQRILPLVSDQRLSGILKSKIEVAVQKSEFCRDWRNRLIAHQDLKLAIEKGINHLKPANQELVKKALDSIADVLNAVILHYNESEIGFGIVHGNGGGESLLYIINDGLRTEEKRTKRIKNSDFREEDFQTRDI
jgi:hypothetical protein